MLQISKKIHDTYVSLSIFLTYVLKSLLDSFFFFIVKVLVKIQKSNQKMVGIGIYSSYKKGIGVAQFWLSFYADPYSFPFFPPFLDLSLKHAPDPHFLIVEPIRLPNKIFLVSCIFSIILIPIASSFWITSLIWWVGWLAELWGGIWQRFCRHLTARIPRKRRRMQGQGGGNVYMLREGDGT